MNMLKEREFDATVQRRPVDNRYGAYGQADNAYGAQQQYEDAYRQSYVDRYENNNGYSDGYQRNYYGEQYNSGAYSQPQYGQDNGYGAYRETFSNEYVPYQQQQRYQGYDMPANSYDNVYSAGMHQQGMQQFERYESSSVQKSAKRTLNAKSKMLIAVYFVLVAVIATLIIVNVVAFGNGSVDAQGAPTAELNGEALGMAVAQDGTSVPMQDVSYLENYAYDTSTNWFDNFCDWVSNLNK